MACEALIAVFFFGFGAYGHKNEGKLEENGEGTILVKGRHSDQPKGVHSPFFQNLGAYLLEIDSPRQEDFKWLCSSYGCISVKLKAPC